MDLFKKIGCPNCKSENSEDVFNLVSFNKYRKLVYIGNFGKATRLFQCKKCETKYFRINEGHLLHKLSPRFEQMFFDFFDPENKLFPLIIIYLKEQ
jgi:hypothetical protein